MRKVVTEINDKLYAVYYPDREYVIIVFEGADSPVAIVLSYDELDSIFGNTPLREADGSTISSLIRQGQTVPCN